MTNCCWIRRFALATLAGALTALPAPADEIQFEGRTYTTVDWVSSEPTMATGSVFGSPLVLNVLGVPGSLLPPQSSINGFSASSAPYPNDVAAFGPLNVVSENGHFEALEIAGVGGNEGFLLRLPEGSEPVTSLLLIIGRPSSDVPDEQFGFTQWDFDNLSQVMSVVSTEALPVTFDDNIFAQLFLLPGTSVLDSSSSIVDGLPPVSGVVHLEIPGGSLVPWRDTRQQRFVPGIGLLVDTLRLTFAVTRDLPPPPPGPVKITAVRQEIEADDASMTRLFVTGAMTDLLGENEAPLGEIGIQLGIEGATSPFFFEDYEPDGPVTASGFEVVVPATPGGYCLRLLLDGAIQTTFDLTLGSQGPVGPQGPTGPPGALDQQQMDAILRRIECNRVVSVLTAGKALRVNRHGTRVALDPGRAATLGVPISKAIECARTVFGEKFEIVVKGNMQNDKDSDSEDEDRDSE